MSVQARYADYTGNEPSPSAISFGTMFLQAFGIPTTGEGAGVYILTVIIIGIKMNSKVFIHIVLFSVFLAGCNKPELPIKVLQVNKSISIDLKYLESNGFQRVNGIDVPIFEKSNGDTTISFQLGQKREEGVYLKYWTFPIDSISGEYLREIFSQKNSYILINECAIRQKEDFSFIINKDGVIYPSFVNYDGENVIVRIHYYYDRTK